MNESGGWAGPSGTHLLADRAEDTSRHATEAVKHLEERDDGQNSSDELDNLYRDTNTAIRNGLSDGRNDSRPLTWVVIEKMGP